MKDDPKLFAKFARARLANGSPPLVSQKPPRWELLHPRMAHEHLGFIPGFLDEDDPRPAKEQFNERYVFGGWQPFQGHKLQADNTLKYPGDPPMRALAQTKLRDELIILYEGEWVAIIQPDRSFEVSRMD